MNSELQVLVDTPRGRAVLAKVLTRAIEMLREDPGPRLFDVTDTDMQLLLNAIFAHRPHPPAPMRYGKITSPIDWDIWPTLSHDARFMWLVLHPEPAAQLHAFVLISHIWLSEVTEMPQPRCRGALAELLALGLLTKIEVPDSRFEYYRLLQWDCHGYYWPVPKEALPDEEYGPPEVVQEIHTYTGGCFEKGAEATQTPIAESSHSAHSELWTFLSSPTGRSLLLHALVIALPSLRDDQSLTPLEMERMNTIFHHVFKYDD